MQLGVGSNENDAHSRQRTYRMIYRDFTEGWKSGNITEWPTEILQRDVNIREHTGLPTEIPKRDMNIQEPKQ